MQSASPTPNDVIVHCSDIHVGHGFQPHVAERLLSQISAIRPGAVVVSGDITMRARRGQFAIARSYLERIEQPLMVLPGNHDVPLYNLYARITNPFGNYNAFATGLDTNPIQLNSVAVIGINSVNPR